MTSIEDTMPHGDDGTNEHSMQQLGSKIESMDEHSPLILDCNSLQDVQMIVELYKERTNSGWCLYGCSKDITLPLADALKQTNLRLLFELNSTEGNPRKMMDFGYLDYPFVRLGSMEWKCHQGSDNNKGKKLKNQAKIHSLKKSGYEYRSKKSTTKKLGCPSAIYVWRTLHFPHYKIENYSELKTARLRKAKEEMSASLREALIHNAKQDVYCREVFRIMLPAKSSHQNHVVDGLTPIIRQPFTFNLNTTPSTPSQAILPELEISKLRNRCYMHLRNLSARVPQIEDLEHLRKFTDSLGNISKLISSLCRTRRMEMCRIRQVAEASKRALKSINASNDDESDDDIDDAKKHKVSETIKLIVIHDTEE